MDQILIKDLQVRAVIGIDEEERSHLSDILINLVLYTDTAKAGQSDDILDCVNYSSVSKQVRRLVEKVARHTVEALAEDIAGLCLGMLGIQGVKVRVEKPNVVQFARLVGVEIERCKSSINTNDGKTEEIADGVPLLVDRKVQSKDWKVRRAEVSDIPAMVELRLGMFQSMGYREPEDLSRLRKDSIDYMNVALPDGEYKAWVVEAKGDVVASGGLVIHSAPPAVRNSRGLEGYVMSIFTVPEWRKQGMARAIMQAILDYLRSNDITVVTLRATDEGRSLYTSLGFEPADRTMILDIR